MPWSDDGSFWPIATGAILTAAVAFGALRTWLDLRLAPPGRDDTGQLQGGTGKEVAQARTQRHHHVVSAAGFSS